ncbi:hypothetical protein GCM10010377_30470 [Streptomyces viridiviolaceus]|uniref:Uncharacterized protein n=1 Tax=Streptomyces viridiviolaceus TaxID=68282 RepID=A0ABW2EA20_9ACTN|nr:hypothetical protein [Streptomyces viridiviolaceus]GHB37371.1 hypothetical protein GCM10010377_30470 [Streptomyces viridiviolaceus]
MSQQYPQQPNPPQQPGWGGPQNQPPVPGYSYTPPAPEPPKKRKVGKIVLGALAVFVVIGIAANAGGGDDSADTSGKDKAVAAEDKPKAAEAEGAAEEEPAARKKSQAEEFQACVAKSGTGTEKAAVEHVTKVTGADKRNDILDSAEVYTDFTGGLMGPHQGEGKLIASAFASCYESDNGLVTVYDKDGEILSNGNY